MSQIENKNQLETEKLNNKYDVDLKKLEIQKETNDLLKDYKLKLIEKDRIIKELDTQEKIIKVNNTNDENMKKSEIQYIQRINEAELKTEKTVKNAIEDFTKRKYELELEKIRQNNKFEEESKNLSNNGEEKMQKIELDKLLKLKKQDNEKQRKDMILDIFDKVLQNQQIFFNQNKNN